MVPMEFYQGMPKESEALSDLCCQLLVPFTSQYMLKQEFEFPPIPGQWPDHE
jgi:hypothetical protein